MTARLFVSHFGGSVGSALKALSIDDIPRTAAFPSLFAHAQYTRRSCFPGIACHPIPIMAPQEEELKKRVGRKLTKKRREGHQATIKMPESLDLGDDAEEDCTAPQGRQALMNQSLFGMIAAAGSQVDFNARFEPQSSDDEDALPHDVQSEIQPGKPERHRRKFSENKLMRSLPRLSTKSSKAKGKGKEASSPAAGSANMAPEEASDTEARDAPVMGRMLEARAELASRPSFDVSTRANDPAEKLGRSSDTTSSSLANRLMEIFQFESPEDVIEGILLDS